MKKYKTVKLPESKVTKTSYASIRKVKSLGSRQSNGNENKRNAQALTLKALRIRRDGSQIGFETVKDSILSYGVCSVCGKGKCILKRYINLFPEKTINVLLEEGLDCAEIVKCFKANKKDWLESVKIQRETIQNEINNLKSDLEKYLNLRAGFIITFDVRNVPMSERSKKNGKSKAKYITSNRERFDSQSLKKQYDTVIRRIRTEIEYFENEIKAFTDYVVPVLLTSDERKDIRNAIAKETNAKKRRKMLFNINRTEFFVVNF